MSNSLVGQMLGSYRVLSVLGQGGMGVVFVGEHNLLGKRAAIKVLLPEYSMNKEIVARFFNEAKSATMIKHPGIVEIFDFGQHANGSAFIVMEYLEGETLSARLKRGLLDIDTLLEITRQMAGALAAAHAAGIVHRDLKPDNIFIVQDPDMPLGYRIKLLDFGIAKLGGDDSSMRTRTGVVMGTPHYMSPEQCKGAGKVDHRADIYSLGCILFEMATGRQPFLFEGSGEIIAAHIFSPPPSIASLVTHVPSEIQKVIERALAKQPDDRPASTTALMAELEMAAPGRLTRNSGQRAAAAARASTPGMDAVRTVTPMSLPPATVSQPPPPSSNPDVASALTRAVSDPSIPHKTTTLRSAASEISSPADKPASRAALWAVAAIVGVVGGGFATYRLLDGKPAPPTPVAVATNAPTAKPPVPEAPASTPPPAPVVAAKPAPKPEPPKPAAPKRVVLTIGSSPEGADVYRAADGARVGTTPFSQEHEVASGELIYFVKLKGYKDEKVELAASGDAHADIAFKKSHDHDHKPASKAGSVMKGGIVDPFAN